MAITNHERVGKALELLRAGLAPFVEGFPARCTPREATMWRRGSSAQGMTGTPSSRQDD
jgi:hypothetical protein